MRRKRDQTKPVYAIYIYTLYRQQLTLLISSNPVLTSLERITRCPRLSFMNNVAINHRHGFKKKNKKKR